MTPAEVHDILGFGPFIVGGGRENVSVLWIGPYSEHVIVYFNRTSGVTDKHFVESTLPSYERVWDNLRESFSGDYQGRRGLPRDEWDPWRMRSEDSDSSSDW
jgi:hypothetical protein